MLLRTKLFLSVILLSITGLDLFGQQSFTLSGYVKDLSNGEDLIGATIYVDEISSGTITNVYGFYSITLIAGVYSVEYRYVGYETIKQEINFIENISQDIELSDGGQELQEVVITAEPEDSNVSSVEMSTNNLDIKTIQKIPAFMGEVDVLKSIQMLPGVATIGEGASGFNVRGGSVGQNLVLLDEAPVYNSSHLLGIFSVFNPDAVKDVKLIKGGIPARYGGRIASILDVRMKEGNSKKLAAQGGVGTIFSRLAIEGPLIKDKASFIVAGRRSYIDWLAKPFVSALRDGARLNFYDLTMKMNYNIDENNRVFVSSYFGRDNFKFDKEQGFDWGNQTATVRWNHLFSKKLFSNFTAFYSNYDYKLAFGQTDDDQFDWDSKITTYDFKPEFTYFINPQNEISFGAEVLLYNFQPANAVGVSNGEVQDVSVDRRFGLESAIYLANDQKVSDQISLQYGLRFSHFTYLGAPTTFFTFDDPTPGLRKEVVAEFEADRFESISNYSNLEPRFSMKYQLNGTNSIKASYNRTSQYIHLISSTTASNPLDVWTPSTNNIKPQTGDQYAIGWFRNFQNNGYEASLEGYYRRTRNQIDYIDGAELLINEALEGDLLSGKGRAYGAEFYLKKNKGRLTGWVSYTLARTELQVDGINQGDWYPTKYDQTHNLKIAAFYEVGGRWTLSSNFTLTSGTPTTFPTSRFEQQGITIPYNAGDSRNNTRIPVYHRLDFSATLQGKEMKNGKKRKNENYWVFSVYNLYSRRNPFSIYFAQEGDLRTEPVPTRATQVSIIGNFVPAVSYNFKF